MKSFTETEIERFEDEIGTLNLNDITSFNGKKWEAIKIATDWLEQHDLRLKEEMIKKMIIGCSYDGDGNASLKLSDTINIIKNI